jgi:hypothetical protein
VENTSFTPEKELPWITTVYFTPSFSYAYITELSLVSSIPSTLIVVSPDQNFFSYHILPNFA